MKNLCYKKTTMRISFEHYEMTEMVTEMVTEKMTEKTTEIRCKRP
jgi:hypothetical protein